MKSSHQLLISLAKQTPYICHHCRKIPSLRRSPRSYSTSTVSNPPSSGCVLLKSRRLIYLSGPDSTHYLQGAITANINDNSTTPRTSGFYSAFLNAQGRVLNDVFIYPILKSKSPSSSLFQHNERFGDGGGADWLIEVDADEAEKLVRHIRKYKLRAKFGVRVLDESEARVWFTWNDSDSSTFQGGRPSSTPSTDNNDNKTQIKITTQDNRAPNFGQRIILPSTQNLKNLIEEEQELSLPEVNETTYQIRRYLHGIPEGQKEILHETALVQESNIDYMGGVDYRKGCYVGQELTIRTHHTGVVRKRILPLMLYHQQQGSGEGTGGNVGGIPEKLEYKDVGGGIDGKEIEEGTSIGRVGKKGRSAGKWLAGVGNLGLGLVRLEVMTGVVVQGEGGGYKDGDEFMLELGEDEGVRVKAFVPSWHLNR